MVRGTIRIVERERDACVDDDDVDYGAAWMKRGESCFEDGGPDIRLWK